MRIREIEAAEVAQWSVRVVEHMARIRLVSGALRPERAAEFVAQNLARFKVGVPRYSRILVNDDLSEWVWIDTAAPVRIVDAYTVSDPNDWAEALAGIVDANELIVDVFGDDDSRGFLSALGCDDVEVEMTSMLPACDGMKVGRVSPVQLRGMRMSELGDFVSRIAGADDASCGAERCDNLDEDDRIVGQHPALVPHTRQHVPLERMLEDGVSTPGHEVLAILVGNKVIGGIWCEIDGRSTRIWRVCIYHGNRGKGYFKDAMSAFVDRVRSDRLMHLGVTVAAYNAAAIGIFESLGFVTSKKVVLARLKQPMLVA
ncbi:GNAT family N-acetyltransferase [Arcanobacterium haemolyticum]|nr:GNAT family N-acetyltransferase [Arcanobacterium haemolyticum]